MSRAQLLTSAAGGTWHGRYGKVKCPLHNDRHASLSVLKGTGDSVNFKCHAGCRSSEIRDHFRRKGLLQGKRWGGLHRTTSTKLPSEGVSLLDYANALRVRLHFLKALGISETSYLGKVALRIPYKDQSGNDHAFRFRLSLATEPKFHWRRGDKPTLYGLERLDHFRADGIAILVEGESDCHVLWFQDQPAIGLPGASTWREADHAKLFEGFATIYVVIESDRGGEAMLEWIAKSSIRDRVKLVRLDGFKDPREMYVADPPKFKERWQKALADAVSWEIAAQARREEIRNAELENCRELAEDQDILERFEEDLRAAGVVGETRNALITFLALVSRLFPRPVSIALKGPSSGGKSFLVKTVLKFFPSDRFYFLTGMSEKALIYSKEPLQNRFIVIAEIHGIDRKFLDYVFRTLLSESKLSYQTTQKSASGAFETVTIVREGPTGLIVTTTAINLHSENETRLLSLTVLDTADQTAAIMSRLARQTSIDAASLSAWHSLQRFLENGPTSVSVPFAYVLSTLIPPVAVRLRRDFSTLLSLIMAHALLHQRNREKSPDGTVIATFQDYAAVRWLVNPIIGESVRTSVPRQVRETVKAVASFRYPGGVTIGELADKLNMDRSAAFRRAQRAIAMGYLNNAEERPGRTMRLVLGEDMPDPNSLLPTAEKLEEHCRVAREKGE